MWLVAAVLLLKLAAAQLTFDEHPVQPPGNVLDTVGLVPSGARGPRARDLAARRDEHNEVGYHHHHHTHVDMIDVKCDSRGMGVKIVFSGPFDGVIYSKGHFDEAKCRYVEPGAGQSTYSFTVPLDDCGTVPPGGFGRSVENIIVIQTDDVVQEIWDSARKISCATTERKEKTVILKPFVVDMLEVVSVPVSTGSVDCWMDIRRGEYPNTAPIEEVIKIGETLTILVYLKDEENQYDIRVRDCWAYDGEDYDSPNTARLQLTDREGCPKKKKLIHFWRRTYQTGRTGASVIAFNKITAFKFPDKMQVFFTCNIEICQGECDGRCSSEPTTPVTFSTPRPGQETTSLCSYGRKDPRCQTERPTTSRPNCYPGENCTDDSTIINGNRVPLCEPGSTDPRCITTKPDITCEFGSKRPECLPTRRPVTPTRRPIPTPSIPHEKDDYHSKDDDPTYHAFHSWQYQRGRPSKRRLFGKRELSDPSSVDDSYGEEEALINEPEIENTVYRKKREEPLKQIVLITLGVRGLMVGSNERQESRAKRDISNEHQNERQITNENVEGLISSNLIGGVIFASALVLGIVVLIARMKYSNSTNNGLTNEQTAKISTIRVL